MNIQMLIIQKSDSIKLLVPYYNFFEKMYGKNFLAPFSKKTLSEGNTNSARLKLLDSNYVRAVRAVNSAYDSTNEKSPIMLGAQAENGNILAVCRVFVGIPQNELNAVISDVILLDESLTQEERIDLYGAIIGKVETLVKDAFEKIEIVSFEVPLVDSEYFVAAEEMGYILDDHEASGYFTCLFDKKIRNKGKMLILENKDATIE